MTSYYLPVDLIAIDGRHVSGPRCPALVAATACKRRNRRQVRWPTAVSGTSSPARRTCNLSARCRHHLLARPPCRTSPVERSDKSCEYARTDAALATSFFSFFNAAFGRRDRLTINSDEPATRLRRFHFHNNFDNWLRINERVLSVGSRARGAAPCGATRRSVVEPNRARKVERARVDI